MKKPLKNLHFLGTVGSEMTSDEDLSSLKLRFLWNKPRSILETPPGYANIELLAKLSFIDDRLACCDMFKDIELLQGYKSGLENQGKCIHHLIYQILFSEPRVLSFKCPAMFFPTKPPIRL